MFVGRHKELTFLEEKYNSEQSEFVVIYGRRRIGKTALIREFIRNKPHIFYSAVQVTDSVQLGKISDVVVQHFGKTIYSSQFSDWEKLFQFVADHVDSLEKLIFVMDEFPYIAQGNRSVPSMMQKQWDLLLSEKKIMVIISGSSMSFMENDILGEKNPLYGRTTGILKLQELDFQSARLFMGKGDIKNHLSYYSVFSGVPYYLKMIDPNKSFRDNLLASIFRSNSVLFNETEFLLKQELREVAQYNAIIESIAHGDTRLNDIYQKTGIEKTKIPYYIGNLMDLGIIRREFPADMKTKEREKSRSGLYKIDNSYFRFFYAFVYPYMSTLTEGGEEIVVDEVVLPEINHFVAYEFENIALRQIRVWAGNGVLPIRPIQLGRWWSKDCELDIFGYDVEGNYLFGECKWRNEKMGLRQLEELVKKSARFKISCEKMFYILFSKSGFSDELLKRAEEDENMLLCDYSGEEAVMI